MSKLTPAQIKWRIKKLAQKNNADPRTLIRIYMMERFLERMSLSQFKDNFIIKGGFLVTSLIGISLRSTLDIDTTIKNLNLSESDIKNTLEKIISIDLQDGISFQIKKLEHIMDEMEYPGIRVFLNASLDKMIIPMKIDISTDDAITPREICYDYKLLFENRSISIYSYNLETLISEKLQTVLVRGLLNTRMRDFYDLHEILITHGGEIKKERLKGAFMATCTKRNTPSILAAWPQIMNSIEQDDILNERWKSYQKKYPYAKDISYDTVLQSVTRLIKLIAA